MKLLISLLALTFITFSCGKECDESTGRKIPLDLSKLSLSGDFNGTFGSMKINFPNDSTTVLTYQENGNTYELTYQIDTINQTYEVYEEKFVN